VLILGRDVIYYVGKEWQTQLETAPDIFLFCHLFMSLHRFTRQQRAARGDSPASEYDKG